MPTDPSEKKLLSRRTFLKKGLIGSALLAASAAGGTISCKRLTPPAKKPLSGRIVGSNHKVGHMLNEAGHFSPQDTEKTGVVIVGGGIAGLSAARELRKHGVDDFLVLELEDKPGGNSASGSNAISGYPWAAHYVPIPGEEAVWVRELFEELGIIEGYNSRGLPVYNEYYLCADPQERLFINGRWQEGLVPHFGISEGDKRQFAGFFGAMERFRAARGNDGRRAFSIPLALSSRDRRFLKYDTISMSRYLSDNGWDSEYLRWYVNYCCRDDYGCVMEDVSAWAGIHYFASRNGSAANADSHALVTWPEGNGWIVNRMAEKLGKAVRCNACALNIETLGNSVAVDYYDVKRGAATRILSEAVIYAAPRFTAFKALKAFREKTPDYAGSFGYGPWMVANVTVRGVPGGDGAPLSWDNVSYYNESLGYVVANHQDITLQREKTVLTFYLPLTAGDPAAERTRTVKTSFEEWTERIVKDLSRMHPGIERDIEEVNIWLWGHAMIRPVPGFIWGKERREALKPHGKIYFAHSDMSGISIFEEAQYRGIEAARAVLKEIPLRQTRRTMPLR